MKVSKNLNNLIESLSILPGVGKKTAERMAYKLLKTNKEKVQNLSNQLNRIITDVSRCKICGIYLDNEDAQLQNATDKHLCLDESRDESVVCITESPSDIYVIENNTNYNGDYFSLSGNISPLDGIGPDEIGIDRLRVRLAKGTIKEIILATSTTIEGEATAHYIRELCKDYDIKVSRIAFGVPLNGEIGYLDSDTLSHAFQARKEI